MNFSELLQGLLVPIGWTIFWRLPLIPRRIKTLLSWPKLPFLQHWMRHATSGVVVGVIDVPIHWNGWWWPAGAAISAGIAYTLSRWLTRTRRKVLREAGAKARARIQTMVETMRERTTPKPVYQPGRQPA